jgi:hypothetical protein
MINSVNVGVTLYVVAIMAIKKVTKINCELYQATSSSDALAIMLAIVQTCVHVTLVKNSVHVKICIGEGR